MRLSLSTLSPSPYYICFATDEKYIPFTCVALYSLIQNSKLDLKRGIVVLFDSVSEQVVDDFISVCDTWGVDICPIIGYLPEFNAYPVSGHISRVAYARLAIPKIFKEKTKQVLYLDGDILIRRELASLLDEACHAPLYAVSDRGVSDFSYLGHGVKDYFNSGVLVYNLKLIHQDVLSVPAGAHLRFHDQDVLNIYFKDSWQEIGRTYNAMTSDYQRAGRAYRRDEILHNPHIVHFNTYLKPWQFGARHPFRHEYCEYWKQTYLKKLHPEWSGVVSFLKTLYHAYVPYLIREYVSRIRYRAKN